MKIFLSLISAAILTLSLSACGDKSEQKVENEAETPVVTNDGKPNTMEGTQQNTQPGAAQNTPAENNQNQMNENTESSGQ